MLKSKQIKTIAYTGLFAGLVFLSTWIFHIPIGSNGGYVHFGDSLIYLAASMLPMPYAMLAAAIGAGLSDILSPGGAIWVLPTILIKPISCLLFVRSPGKILCKRNIAAMFFGGFANTIGYAIATAIITGSVAVAIAEIPLGLLQPIGSGICFVVWSAALDKAGVIKKVPHMESR